MPKLALPKRNRRRSSRKPPSRNPNAILTQNKKEKTSSDNTKLSTRLKCAGTGNSSASASSRTSVPSPTGSTNCTKKCIYLLILKPKSAVPSTTPNTVPMETGANFFILSMIFIMRIRATCRFCRRTNAFRRKGKTY